jgi:excisionase family DNA binding protein
MARKISAEVTSRRKGGRPNGARSKTTKLASAVMSVDEAAAFLGLSRVAAYNAVAKGEIPSLRIGRRWLVPRAKLFAMVGRDAEDQQY